MQTDLITRVTTIAAQNDGRITAQQMRDIGASDSWISRHARAGWFERTKRGSYRIGPAHIAAVRRSAVEDGGSSAMALGVHGLDMWRMLRTPKNHQSIMVWTPTHRRNRSGVLYSNARWVRPSDARTIGGIRVGSRAACIASVASTFEAVDLVALIREACFREPTAAQQLQELVDRGGRTFRGAPRAVCALDWYSNGHCGLDSRTEKSIRAELRRLGAPRPTVNPRLWLPDGCIRPDFYWEEAGLVLEVNPVGHKREWVRLADLGRVARFAQADVRVISLDMTLSAAQRERILREAVRLAHELRPSPMVEILLPGDPRIGL